MNDGNTRVTHDAGDPAKAAMLGNEGYFGDEIGAAPVRAVSGGQGQHFRVAVKKGRGENLGNPVLTAPHECRPQIAPRRGGQRLGAACRVHRAQPGGRFAGALIGAVVKYAAIA